MAIYEQQRILIVDDDEHLLTSLSDFLKHENYYVETATTAEAALDILDDASPDLIILDICMPGMSGIGFLKSVGSRTERMIPILVHTVRSNLEGFIGSLCVGGFIPKPCESSILLEHIRRMLPPLDPPSDGGKAVSQSVFFLAGGQNAYHMERSSLDQTFLKYNEDT